MQAIKIICLGLVTLFCTTKQNNLSAGQITLTINPNSTSTLSNIHTYLNHKFVKVEGFKPDQVSLACSGLGSNDIQFGDCFTIANKYYSPEELQIALRNGAMDNYPLFFHEQLHYLEPNDTLTIYFKISPSVKATVDLPEHITKNLLSILCEDFVNNGISNKDFIQTLFSGTIDFDNLVVQLVQEDKLLAGNPVLLYKKISDQEYHYAYALALGNGLYLTNFAFGYDTLRTILAVTDLKSLLEAYKMTHFARIEI